jgi:hypothetical protein
VADPSSVDSDSFGGRAAGTREDAGVPDAQVAVLQASTLPASFSDASEMDVLGHSSVLIPPRARPVRSTKSATPPSPGPSRSRSFSLLEVQEGKGRMANQEFRLELRGLAACAVRCSLGFISAFL